MGIGLGIGLAGATVAGVVITLMSSYRGAVGMTQDNPAAILAVMAAMMMAALPAGVGPETRLATVVVAMAMSCLLTGLAFLLLGGFRLGTLIRYIPYPVIGGFLAGTGWLLMKGSVGVMAGLPADLEHAAQLWQGASAAKVISGVGLGVVLVLALRRFKHVLVLPGILAGGVACFFLVMLAGGWSLDEAAGAGWLFKDLPDGGLWRPLSPGLLAAVDWGVVLGVLPDMGTVVLVSVVGLLLNASGIELATEGDMELNRELKAAGVANLVAAVAGGGMVGYHALTGSVLTHRLRAAHRASGLIAAGVCAVALFAGATLVFYFPRVVLGGMLFFLGLDFLITWLWDSRKRLPATDYFIIVLILVVVALVGFLEGVGIGILAGTIIFVVNYSRINVVKAELTGLEFRSNVDRPQSARQLLEDRGREIYILKLQGFLFFGTAHDLLQRIQRRVREDGPGVIRYVVLNFKLVTGVDSSAVNSLIRLNQLAGQQGFTVVYTQVPQFILAVFKGGGLPLADQENACVMTDLDRGLEWCEEKLLASAAVSRPSLGDDLLDHFKKRFLPPDGSIRFLAYLEEKEVEPGFCLMSQGEESSDMYFIESGRVSVFLELPDGKTMRLRSMGGGTVVGEVGVYTGSRRTATAMSESRCRVHRMTVEALARMERDDPDLASAFNHFMAAILAERLGFTIRLLMSLED